MKLLPLIVFLFSSTTLAVDTFDVQIAQGSYNQGNSRASDSMLGYQKYQIPLNAEGNGTIQLTSNNLDLEVLRTVSIENRWGNCRIFMEVRYQWSDNSHYRSSKLSCVDFRFSKETKVLLELEKAGVLYGDTLLVAPLHL